jgi:TFIIF-interacting CTD phosphatase-like protein
MSPNKNILKNLKAINIPRTTDKKMLILDLDETLVHSSFKPSNITPDITLKVYLFINLF